MQQKRIFLWEIFLSEFFYDYILGAAHALLSVTKPWPASEVRKVGAWERALPSPRSRRITCNSSGFAKQNLSPFKKGWTLNFFCRTPFPQDRAQQAAGFIPAGISVLQMVNFVSLSIFIIYQKFPILLLYVQIFVLSSCSFPPGTPGRSFEGERVVV